MHDRRHAFDRLRQQLALAHDAQASRPLRDQRIATGQERDGPRLHERLDDGDHAIVVEGGSHDGVAGDADPGREDNSNRQHAQKRPCHENTPRIVDELRAEATPHYSGRGAFGQCPLSLAALPAQSVSRAQDGYCDFLTASSKTFHVRRLSLDRGSSR